MPEPILLEIGREALVDVAASLATRREDALERAFRIAAAVAEPEAVDEVLLQSHLFIGFPLTLEAFVRWRQVAPTGAESPDAEALPQAVGADSDRRWVERGIEVCRTVYGSKYERLRENVRRLHPLLDEWMITTGYGRVIGRPELDLVTRELCVVALLAVWDAPRQLHSHVRGALHAGASPAELAAALEVACRHLAPADAVEVRALLDRVLHASDSMKVASSE